MSIIWFAQMLGLTLVSAALGFVSCWVLWRAFKLICHPEWGALLIATAVALGFAGKLPDSELLRRALTFLVAFAAPFWIANTTQRIDFGDRHTAERKRKAVAGVLDLTHRSAGSSGSAKPQIYPAIAGCIREGRRPTSHETRRVTVRIWREAFATRYPNPGFSEKRAALRAARAALEGS